MSRQTVGIHYDSDHADYHSENVGMHVLFFESRWRKGYIQIGAQTVGIRDVFEQADHRSGNVEIRDVSCAKFVGIMGSG